MGRMIRVSVLAIASMLVACGGGGGDGGGGGGGGDDSGPEGDGGSDPGADAAAPCPVAEVTAVDEAGGADTAALDRAEYDYAPAVMLEDGVYRMWWCGGVAGDHILYAEASDLDGPWHAHGSDVADSYDDVFQPTGDTGDFDGTHTCDPSVIVVDGTYYMYYGGYPLPGEGDTTRLGLATSADGMAWTRANGGAPLFVPAGDYTDVPNAYGLGQPSATYVDGHVYLSFTDTTAEGANAVNGAGQFVVRSPDPGFGSDVEELTEDGFAPYEGTTTRPYSFTEAFSPDWLYADTLGMFVVAVDGTPDVIELRFFDRDLALVTSEQIDFSWSEGPGLVHRPDGHLPEPAACGELGVDLMRAVGATISEWDLAHAGATVTAPDACDCSR